MIPESRVLTAMGNIVRARLRTPPVRRHGTSVDMELGDRDPLLLIWTGLCRFHFATASMRVRSSRKIAAVAPTSYLVTSIVRTRAAPAEGLSVFQMVTGQASDELLAGAR